MSSVEELIIMSANKAYQVRAVPLGFSLMFGAGILSGLLGIGSGAAKVLAMDKAMRIPFRCPPRPVTL